MGIRSSTNLFGTCAPGKYKLGRWGLPVNIGALIYGVAAIVNLAWPREPYKPWYDDYIIAILSVAVVGLGAVYLVLTRADQNSDAPHNDAIPAR